MTGSIRPTRTRRITRSFRKQLYNTVDFISGEVKVPKPKKARPALIGKSKSLQSVPADAHLLEPPVPKHTLTEGASPLNIGEGSDPALTTMSGDDNDNNTPVSNHDAIRRENALTTTRERNENNTPVLTGDAIRGENTTVAVVNRREDDGEKFCWHSHTCIEKKGPCDISGKILARSRREDESPRYISQSFGQR